MSIDIAVETDPSSWDGLVDRATDATPFHRHGALSVFADHTGTELHPLVGYKGQEPVGLLPVFSMTKGPVTLAFSPPPNRKITYLGPVLLSDPNMKRRTRERRHRRFVGEAVSHVDEEIGARYVNVRTAPGYGDPRPFLWNGFTATPRYTYHVDLDRDPDTILAAASSDLRSNVRNTDEEAFEIRSEGRPGMERVVRRAKRRHEEQGVPYDVTPGFVRDLSRAIPDRMESYVCTANGEFAGGGVVLFDEDTVYRWQSVADFDAPVPAQDLVDWHVITEGIDRGLSQYDLVGANNRRLCKYKSKFAPEVETYYGLERSGPAMGALTSVYSRVRDVVSG
ncbi:GNAT family N-acetyltransferase [Halorubrum sp. JWXQ-INN 858]|uniref:GNAT family N-acetyltransferase n=1 Tax=Halorubrum sp. JWXQ-INN 858 TaxID=2690782 RepID=UPI0013569676|nr:GNAT family N-acetyltransferase [Halorubrum sp. JWXQ-INN 858]MWV65475.1 GNAT family N-acetyltransferase [Halorubrum sp. JWXQ-INN 858]